MILENKYFEIWYDEINHETSLPNSILILVSNRQTPGEVMVINPQEGNRVEFRGRNYEEAMYWLCEDEFERVSGREHFDDGVPEPTLPDSRT